MEKIRNTIAGIALILALTGCAGLDTREQRMLSGGAIGAAGGAAIGAIAGSPAAGAAIGGVAGVAGGFVVDELAKNRQEANEAKAN